jgi:AraC-like DNA-binding protein
MNSDWENMSLANGAGSFRETASEASLRQHFVGRWLYRIPDGTVRDVIVLPDGYVHLRWLNGALSIAGPAVRARAQTLEANSAVIGWRFKPGAASRWLQMSISEIVGRCIPLDEIWGRQARTLGEWAAEARSAEEVARRVEHGLAERAVVGTRVSIDAPAIFALLSGDNDAASGVDRLLRCLGLSSRSLHRRCCEEFGFGPKTLERILRFQRFLQTSKAGGMPGLANRAMEAGYSDHAHLSRECRRLSGLTPSRIARQLRP